MFSRLKHIGPGAMVAAAFIGPGTVTTASLAGMTYGYSLLWTVLFSVLSTWFLQEMAGRLGVVTQMGLGEALRGKLNSKVSNYFVITIVLSAILIGNAAYEAGNITGVSIGIDLAADQQSAKFTKFVPLIVGSLAGLLLFSGKYKLIERSLIFLVGAMGTVFIVSAIMAGPDYTGALKGLFVPHFPKGAGLTIIGLIGTTVVPYNLFLHASSAATKWKNPADLVHSRRDTAFSILLGGLITMAILISAATLQHTTASNPAEGNIGSQLAPLLGKWSAIFMGSGFLAAGLSSAITAPLAAAYASTEILGWNKDLTSGRFRAFWVLVLLSGILFASFQSIKPVTLILFAQVANGLLLPIVAFLLLWIMNDKELLGSKSNTAFANAIGILIILTTLTLGTKSVLTAFGIF